MQMEEIRTAIEHGAAAGKLRAYVRENGSGLAGLIRLAERHSAAGAAAIAKMAAETGGEDSGPRLTSVGMRLSGHRSC